MPERRRPRNPDGPNLRSIRLPFEPIRTHMTIRARRAGYELLGEWMSNHPHATESDRRAWFRAERAGTISAQVADRWGIRLLDGLTLDELYGPDWDDPAHTAAA